MNRCNLTAEVKCGPDEAAWGTDRGRALCHLGRDFAEALHHKVRQLDERQDRDVLDDGFLNPDHSREYSAQEISRR